MTAAGNTPPNAPEAPTSNYDNATPTPCAASAAAWASLRQQEAAGTRGLGADLLLLVGIAVEVARPDGETLAVQVEVLWHAVGGVFWPMVRMMLRKRAAVA